MRLQSVASGGCPRRGTSKPWQTSTSVAEAPRRWSRDSDSPHALLRPSAPTLTTSVGSMQGRGATVTITHPVQPRAEEWSSRKAHTTGHAPRHWEYAFCPPRRRGMSTRTLARERPAVSSMKDLHSSRPREPAPGPVHPPRTTQGPTAGRPRFTYNTHAAAGSLICEGSRGEAI